MECSGKVKKILEDIFTLGKIPETSTLSDTVFSNSRARMSRSLQFVLITIAALAILWMLLSIFFDFVVRMTMFPAVGFESTEIDPAFRKAYAAEHITIDTDAGDAVSALYFT